MDGKAKFIHIANVYCFGNQRKQFCYKIPNGIDNSSETDRYKGSLVKVEFGKKILIGIVISIEEKEVKNNTIELGNKPFEVGKIKEIKEIIWQNLISDNFINFLQKMAWYNVIDVERLLENAVPSAWLNKKRELKTLAEVVNIAEETKIASPIKLNEEQEEVAKNIKTSGFFVSLIRGAMCSGKTFMFLEVVRRKLLEDDKNQVLIMMPEIALTNNLIKVIHDLTGIKPIIWHSSVSLAKKKIYYENIINGNVKIIISTRSGLLLPYKNLSLIVIDEEHDRSYKQDEIPCYHARDMAILRAKYENIPVILSSATPSVETLRNVMDKKYELFSINKQYFEVKPPQVKIIGLPEKNIEIISQEARESILRTKQKGEQSMIFINRRGYSRTLKCDDCGYEANCENCDNLLSYHKNKNFLKCHYCGYKIPNIVACQNCGSKNLQPNKGVGVEQVEKEIQKFANDNGIELRTLLFSSDEITKESDIDAISNEIKNGGIDVIIGTQIMTKGHHFPRLTNIIILDIDGMALDGDFRAFERMFQMLFQLSGRAGREKTDAVVYIQTANPRNNVLQTIKNHDIKRFYADEIKQREKFVLPPFSRFTSITISAEDKEIALQTAKSLEQELRKKMTSNVEIFGPAESNIHYLKRNYRYRFLLKSPKTSAVQNALNDIRKNFQHPQKVQVKFDVDCYDFL